MLPSSRAILEYGVRIAFIIAALAFTYSVWGSSRHQDPPTVAAHVTQLSEPIQLKSSDLLTPLPDRQLRILEFADFECPFCVRHARETLPSLRAEFVERGLVSYEFRHLPLEAIHPNARPAARAAECAREQQQFWPFHDRLLGLRAPLTSAQIQRIAESSVPDAAALKRCLQEPAVDSTIEADLRLAALLGIRSTPGFVIVRGSAQGPIAIAAIDGAVSLETFREAIRIGTRNQALTR